MILKPEWFFIPDYVKSEITECRCSVEAGLFGVGLVVDANNLMYRLAFASSKDVSEAGGMLAVFEERVESVAKQLGAEAVICCIDSGVSLRRQYFGARKKPDKTPEQEKVVELARAALHMLRDGLTEAKFNPVYRDGYEGDDIVAAYALSGLCVNTVLYSTDSDLYQVTNGSTVTQMSPADGRFLKSEVPQIFVPGVKALMGDSSDSIEGMKGVGPVTALKILTGEKNLDVSYEDALRLRNNLTLTCLPMPGAHMALREYSVANWPQEGVMQEGERRMEDDEPLPF